MNREASLPFFSVVMSVYNGERYLAEAITSVIAQTDRDWEMTVVDDASLDGTPGILAGYTAIYPNIRVFKNEENLGIAKSVNRGIAEARGEWIVRFDSDDLFAPGYLETLRPVIAGLPHPYCFVSTWATVIDGKGEKVIDVRLPSAKTIERMMNFENFLYQPGTSFPKMVWERVGGYPEEDRKLAEDLEMWKRFLKNGVSLVMVPQHLVSHRIHGLNITSFKDRRFIDHEDPVRALSQQYYEWRISLFLKQGDFRAARREILLLKKTQKVFSLKNLFYYFMTLLPRSLVYGFMWKIRPRLRHFFRVSKGHRADPAARGDCLPPVNVLISILKYPPDYTGAGFITHRLFRSLKTKGVARVAVITTSLEARGRLTELEGIEVHAISVNHYVEKQTSLKNILLKTFFIIISAFKVIGTYFRIERDYALVYTVDASWLSSAVSFCARFTRKPVIKEIVLMGADDPMTLNKKPFLVRPLFLLPFKWASMVVAISPPLKESCLAAGIPENKIWLRYTPIYLDDGKEAPATAGISRRLDPSARKILWVGTVSPRKDVEFLVHSGFHLEGRVQLVFVGPFSDAEYFERVSNLAARMEAETGGRVTAVFSGRTDNRRELHATYAACDLFWFASRFEGLPNVVLESLFCGTPVVTLPVNGIMRHLITESLDGEVVDTADPRIFAECVNRHLRDYAMLHDRQRLKKRSEDRFDAVKIEDDYILRFNGILGRKQCEHRRLLGIHAAQVLEQVAH